jgi:hypothetical protein
MDGKVTPKKTITKILALFFLVFLKLLQLPKTMPYLQS